MTLLRGEQRAVIKAPRFVLPPIKDLGPGKEKAKAASPSPAIPAAPAPLITVPIAPVPPQ
jgi:hypothetical protein